MKYSWILFDADDTLFHFDSFSGLQLMFSKFNINFTKTDFDIYQVLNKQLWIDYQNNKVTATQIKHTRFESWSNKLGVPTDSLNKEFLNAMAKISTPIDGAGKLLDSIHGKSKIGIITNGFTDLQEVRLQKNNLRHYVDLLIISEEVGYAKPHQKIFDHAITKMGYPEPKSVLMVGDNIDSDIIGGVNAGFDTCWFNAHNKVKPNHVSPKYQISSLHELAQIILD